MKGINMKITKEMINKTIELMQKHLPDSKDFQNEKFAKVYLKEFINFINKCEDCEGKGYYTDVISTGLSDPKDPYHEPHIERCDTCQVFSDDEKAKEYHERHA